MQDILAKADERGVGWDNVATFTDGEARRLVRGNQDWENPSCSSLWAGIQPGGLQDILPQSHRVQGKAEECDWVGMAILARH